MMKPFFTLIVCLLAAQSEASVKSYFNHNQKNQYTDPYRNITRPGDDLEQVILDQIKLAKRSIFIAVQELRLPLVASALVEKKKAGVDVRVVLEHDYNFTVLSQKDGGDESEHEGSRLVELKALIDVNKNGKFEIEELETRDAIYMLKRAGIPMIDDTSDDSKGSGLMHHKFMVVDEKSTIVSTANFTTSCIHGDLLEPKSRGNANSLVHVRSLAFAKIFTQEFLQLWGNGRRGNFGHSKTYRGPQTVTIRGKKLTVQFSPTSKRYHWEESVNGLSAQYLKSAESSIKAALFVFSDQKLANAMEVAHENGAHVGVLVESGFAYRYYSDLLDLLGLSMLSPKCSSGPDNNPWVDPITEGGFPVLNQGDILHHKFAVVDEKSVIVGSQNWSDAANFLNDETLMVIEDESVSDMYSQEYKRLLKNSVLGAPTRVLTQIHETEKTCAKQVVLP